MFAIVFTYFHLYDQLRLRIICKLWKNIIDGIISEIKVLPDYFPADLRFVNPNIFSSLTKLKLLNTDYNFNNFDLLSKFKHLIELDILDITFDSIRCRNYGLGVAYKFDHIKFIRYYGIKSPSNAYYSQIKIERYNYDSHRCFGQDTNNRWNILTLSQTNLKRIILFNISSSLLAVVLERNRFIEEIDISCDDQIIDNSILSKCYRLKKIKIRSSCCPFDQNSYIPNAEVIKTRLTIEKLSDIPFYNCLEKMGKLIDYRICYDIYIVSIEGGRKPDPNEQTLYAYKQFIPFTPIIDAIKKLKIFISYNSLACFKEHLIYPKYQFNKAKIIIGNNNADIFNAMIEFKHVFIENEALTKIKIVFYHKLDQAITIPDQIKEKYYYFISESKQYIFLYRKLI